MNDDTVYADDPKVVDEYHMWAWSAYEELQRSGGSFGAEEQRQYTDEITAFSLATIATIMYRRWIEDGRP